MPPGVIRQHPWTHFVLDDFLIEEEFEKFAKAASDPSRVFLVQPNDPHRVEYSLLHDVQLASQFLSAEFVRLVRLLTGDWCYPSDGNIQVRRADAHTPEFPAHHDSGGGTRAYVSLYYTSPAWSEADRGRLRLHSTKTGSQESIIDPLPNRLVLFEASDKHLHSVEKTVANIRYSILIEWLCIDR